MNLKKILALLGSQYFRTYFGMPLSVSLNYIGICWKLGWKFASFGNAFAPSAILTFLIQLLGKPKRTLHYMSF